MKDALRGQLFKILIERYGNIHAASVKLGMKDNRIYSFLYRGKTDTADVIFDKLKLQIKG